MTRAIVLVDHGSRRAEANELLPALAEQLRARWPERFVAVAHMELAAPSVAQAIAACVEAGAGEVVVQPWFLGPGRHTTHDIPRLVREAAAAHAGLRVRLAEPLGLHEKLLDVIQDRVDDARPLD